MCNVNCNAPVFHLPVRCTVSGDDDLPLCGKRVLVTAPRQYAGKLCGLLIEAGACAISLPMIRIGRIRRPQAIEVCQMSGVLAPGAQRPNPLPGICQIVCSPASRWPAIELAHLSDWPTDAVTDVLTDWSVWRCVMGRGLIGTWLTD